MSWRIAASLDQLRTEVNAAWPDRNKASDGVVGDAAHAATASDHNPNAAGVVCAFDITHDPASGCDGHVISEQIRCHPQPDVKYVIFAGRLFSAYGSTPFQWRPYTGPDPHTSHVHVSVGVGRDGQSQQPYDDTDPWLTSSPQQGDDELTPEENAALSRIDTRTKEQETRTVALAADVAEMKKTLAVLVQPNPQIAELLAKLGAK